MSKPRLFLRAKLWHCLGLRGGLRRRGYGYTPLMAYREWERLQ